MFRYFSVFLVLWSVVISVHLDEMLLQPKNIKSMLGDGSFKRMVEDGSLLSSLENANPKIVQQVITLLEGLSAAAAKEIRVLDANVASAATAKGRALTAHNTAVANVNTANRQKGNLETQLKNLKLRIVALNKVRVKAKSVLDLATSHHSDQVKNRDQQKPQLQSEIKTINSALDLIRSLKSSQTVALNFTNGWTAYGHGFSPVTFTITNGICILEGLVNNTAKKWGKIGQLPAKCTPKIYLYFDVNAHEKSACVLVHKNGGVYFMSGAKRHFFVSLSGIYYPVAGVQKNNLAFVNGWNHYDYSNHGPVTYTITHGFCILQGLVRGSKWGHLMATLPATCRPKVRSDFSVTNYNNPSRVDVLRTGQIYWQAGGRSHGWISFSGIAFRVVAGQGSLSFFNGWKPHGSPWNPSYTVTDGICFLEGLGHSSQNKWGHFATLPKKCRPRTRLMFSVNNHGNSSRVDVLTNGQVHWVTGGRDHRWLSLAGITFITA